VDEPVDDRGSATAFCAETGGFDVALALYTFGMFAAPAEDPANDGFRDLNDPIFELVDRAEGLIARSGYASDPGPLPRGADWGAEVDRGIPLMGALVRPRRSVRRSNRFS
jgi:hypothetical protein